MGLFDAVKAGGFVPKVNEDGVWKPYDGDYLCEWKTLRKEDRKDGSSYYIAEWEIIQTFDGMQKRESKYPAFKQYYSFDLSSDGSDERQKKELEKLLKDAFTVGVELDASSDDALATSAEALIGKQTYIHAFPKKSWKQEGGEWVENPDKGMKQGISVRLMSIATKKWPMGGNPL
jgi:hypothetical protein